MDYLLFDDFKTRSLVTTNEKMKTKNKRIKSKFVVGRASMLDE